MYRNSNCHVRLNIFLMSNAMFNFSRRAKISKRKARKKARFCTHNLPPKEDIKRIAHYAKEI